MEHFGAKIPRSFTCDMSQPNVRHFGVDPGSNTTDSKYIFIFYSC